MKLFVMDGCPGCKAVTEKIEELKVENRFEMIDIKDNYEGFVPEQVPVLQDEAVGTMVGEVIINFLDKVYG